MTGRQKKLTVKDLSEELQTVKEQVKEIPYLKQTIVKLLAIVETLKTQEVPVVTSSHEVFECRKCDYKSSSKKSLKKHVKTQHPARIQCDFCDENFETNFDLETHVEDEHQAKKNFKCEVCNKDFFLQWRFDKHKSVHLETTKACHFNSSKKFCPFQRIGCKFRHDEAVNLTKEPNHDTETLSDGDSDENDENVIEEHLEDDQKDDIDVGDSGSAVYGENDCHLCTDTFTCLDELCEHFQVSHTEYYMKTQNLVVF